MNKKRFQKIAVSVAGVLSFVICGFLYSCTYKGNTVYTIEQSEFGTGQEVSGQDASGQEVSGRTEEAEWVSETNSQLQQVFVYVCGNVVNPGVYGASPEARVYELIDMAGGASENGCLEALNLAEHIYDGQKLYVPDYDEYASGTEWQYNEENSGAGEDTGTGLVNINTADVQLLMTLPGVGQSRAQAIVDYRNEHGSFECIEDIMNVNGIKEGAFSKLRDYICVK